MPDLPSGPSGIAVTVIPPWFLQRYPGEQQANPKGQVKRPVSCCLPPPRVSTNAGLVQRHLFLLLRVRWTGGTRVPWYGGSGESPNPTSSPSPAETSVHTQLHWQTEVPGRAHITPAPLWGSAKAHGHQVRWQKELTPGFIFKLQFTNSITTLCKLPDLFVLWFLYVKPDPNKNDPRYTLSSCED